MEIKYGIYVTVWTVRLKKVFFTSLSKMARIIGAGNPKTMLNKLIDKVLRNSLKK